MAPPPKGDASKIYQAVELGKQNSIPTEAQLLSTPDDSSSEPVGEPPVDKRELIGELGRDIRSSNAKSLEAFRVQQAYFEKLADHFDAFRDKEPTPSQLAEDTLLLIKHFITRQANLASTGKFSPQNTSDTRSTLQTTSGLSSTLKKTWAEVAKQPALSTPHRPTPLAAERKAVTKTDNRVMVRLPSEALARQMSAGDVLKAAREVLRDNATDVRSVQFVPSGVALVANNEEAKQRILDKAEALKESYGATTVEPQFERDSFIIPHAPREDTFKIRRSPTGDTEIIRRVYDKKAYADELATVLGHAPLSVGMADNGTELTSTLFVSFPPGTVKPARRLNLFQYTLSLVASKRKPKVQQCPRCWRFHGARGCTRQPLCRLCGSSEHSEEGHPLQSTDAEVAVSKCANCRGPHAADHHACLLRPKYENGRRCVVTKTQRGAIRASQHNLRVKAVTEMALGLKARLANTCSTPEEPVIPSTGVPKAQDERRPQPLNHV